ncbi:MAG: response regulator [Verrucomicrobia bacterium]|nr:response regulator [Verrucomicrobiota bacterium]
MQVPSKRRSLFPVWSQPLVIIAGVLSIGLGLMVAVGWHTDNWRLTKVDPRYAAMPYLAALGFICCGAGLTGLFFRRVQEARWFGIATVAIGALALLRLIYGGVFDVVAVPLVGILHIEIAAASALAPNTALSLLLVGLAITFLAVKEGEKQNLVVPGLLSSVTVALGLVALYGYVSDVETASRWGRLSRMAFHAAAGFSVVGTGVFVYAWREGVRREADTPRWMAVPVFVWSMTLVLAVWQALVAADTDPTMSNLIGMAGLIMSCLMALNVHFSNTSEMRAREIQLTNEVLESEITDRKTAEEAMRETNRELKRALAELRQTQDGLIRQERLTAMGQMASGIAHDVNNALTIITGYCELMQSGPEFFEDATKAEQCVGHIQMAAEDAASVVKRLQELYRQSDEKKRVFPLSLNQICEEAVQLTQPKWKDDALSQGATIGVSLELKDIPLIGHDKSALREVLTNFIFNAVDAMPQGGTLTVATRADENFVSLVVSDTGMGMSEEVRKRCLEPFFTTKEGRGTGLGLSLAHSMVQRFGGKIDVESEEGKGTTFIVRFPVHEDAFENALGADVADEPVADQLSLRVLIVEDEPAIRELISQLLEVDKHRVTAASGGEEAIKEFEMKPFDLVITDNAMPGMIGKQVAIAIKRINGKIPIIMLTGFADMMRSKNEYPEGIDALLGKPVTLKVLREAIAEVTALAA